ncbi:MAG: transglycosylase SLT domain-containing protein [Candidatus Sericytochromatia bacterium]|nr:transglycosylase SLT domain-containing protein [Candidatus Sericytochromatia bacterium]
MAPVRRWFTPLLILVTVAPLQAMAPVSAMTKGKLAYRLGNYESAERLFAEATGRGEASEAALWQGRAAWRLGHSEAALGAWRVAAGTPTSREEAEGALATARDQLFGLTSALDRYGAMRLAGDGGPGATPEDWRTLAAEFDGLAGAAGGSLVGRRAALLAADALARAGDNTEATARFEAQAGRHSAIADWVLWRLAAVDAGQAARHLTALIERHPDSPLRMEARVMLAERTKDPVRARRILEAVVMEGGRKPAAERALYLLAQQNGGRQALLQRYWNTYPEGRWLDDVVRDLAQRPGLTPDTRYRIGSYFFFKSEYALAAEHFARVNSPMADYRRGRSYWGLDQLDRAVATLKAVVGRDRSLTGKAWLTIGQIEGQRGRWGAAVAAYHKAASFGGEAGVTARAKLAKAYREQGESARAKALERAILVQYPWSEEATNIAWADFIGAIRTRRFQDALVAGRRLATHNPHHAYGLAAQYWIGRIHEKMGRRQQAVGTYRALIGRSPTSYYGWRATFRDRVLSGRGADPWFATVPGRTVADLPVRYTDLLGPEERALAGGAGGSPLPREMREWPEAVRELLFLRQFEVAGANIGSGASPNLRAWLSLLQHRYAEAIQQERGEPRLSYPLGYAPLLLAAARRHGIDPLLLAALVREESRFDPRAKSWVGATGLAQLMPFTAEWVVKQVPDVTGRPLTDPHANLQLGAWYLGHTHRTFDGASALAVAAYNGGPGAVARWRRGFQGDLDEWVESIPYNETRLYVKKVFASYWNYQRLYGRG